MEETAIFRSVTHRASCVDHGGGGGGLHELRSHTCFIVPGPPDAVLHGGHDVSHLVVISDATRGSGRPVLSLGGASAQAAVPAGRLAGRVSLI